VTAADRRVRKQWQEYFPCMANLVGAVGNEDFLCYGKCEIDFQVWRLNIAHGGLAYGIPKN
jgi:hypothetical protein